MRFIDKLSTFYIQLFLTLFLLIGSYLLEHFGDSHSSVVIVIIIWPLLLIKDVIFFIIADSKESKVKSYYKYLIFFWVSLFLALITLGPIYGE